MDFSRFDKEVDTNKVNKAIEEQGKFENVPKGTYLCDVEKLEIGKTKEGSKPMFTLCLKVKEGEYKGRLLFMNRVLYGNKVTEKWNDEKAIAGVMTILSRISGENEKFINYTQLSDRVADIYEQVQGTIEIECKYDAEAFNTIDFKDTDVYDLA